MTEMVVNIEPAFGGFPGALTSKMSKRPLDLVHLSRYTLGDRELEREVLQLFRKQAGLYLDRLKQAGSHKAWHDAAHTIKGSARGIGAWKVARTAEAAEHLNGENKDAGAADMMATLESEIGEVDAYISMILEDA